MKKITWVCLFIAAVICASFLFKQLNDPAYILKSNEKELAEIVENILADGTALHYEKYKNMTILYNAGDGKVCFCIASFGFGSSSSYEGLYYSVDGKAKAYILNTDTVTFTAKGDGWEWQGDGDNTGYTEKIKGNWYRFKAYF